MNNLAISTFARDKSENLRNRLCVAYESIKAIREGDLRRHDPRVIHEAELLDGLEQLEKGLVSVEFQLARAMRKD